MQRTTLETDIAVQAAFRLTDATAKFLRQDEQDEFFHRALGIVRELLEQRRTQLGEPSRN